MKTDRELLELAAKAADVQGEWCDCADHAPGILTPNDAGRPWNALVDDGDALRLLVQLKLHVGMESNVANVWAVDDFRNFQTVILRHHGDEAALRRAIVLAAAAVAERRAS